MAFRFCLLLVLTGFLLPFQAAAAKKPGDPSLRVDPTEHDFGTIQVGDSVDQIFRLSNAGNGDLSLFSVTLEGSGASFAINPDDCPDRLAPKKSCRVQVSFAPLVPGALNAEMTINSDDPEHPILTIPLSGVGESIPQPGIEVSPTAVDFPVVAAGESVEVPIVITNVGEVQLQMGTLTGPDPPFSMEDGCSDLRLEPGQTCSLSMWFSPTEPGTFNANLIIPSDDPGQPTVTVNLLGTTLSEPGTDGPDIHVTDSVAPGNDRNIPFGVVPMGVVKRKTVLIINRGNEPLQLGLIGEAQPLAAPFAIEADKCSDVLLQPLGACTLEIIFTPIAIEDVGAEFDIPSNDPDESLILFAVSGSGGPASTDFPAPRLIHPDDGESNLLDNVLFRWYNCRDPAGNLATYQFYLGQEPTFGGVQPRQIGATALRLGLGLGAALFLLLGYFRRGWQRSGLVLLLLALICLAAACSEDIEDSSSTNIGNLQKGQTYYWKVVAQYGDGIETSSGTRSFRVH